MNPIWSRAKCLLPLTIILFVGCNKVRPYKVSRESGVPYIIDINEDRNDDGMVDYTVMIPTDPTGTHSRSKRIFIDGDYDGYYDKQVFDDGGIVSEEYQRIKVFTEEGEQAAPSNR